MPVGFIYAVLIITIVVIAVVVFSPSITVGRGGKILAFLSLFLLPVLSGGLGYEQHMERSKQTPDLRLPRSDSQHQHAERSEILEREIGWKPPD